ncbi:MAG: GNAT family N-acetyltransferase [Pseudomonadota bacterium]
MKDFEVRQSNLDDFKTAVSWAHAEGWNPGHDDLPPFFAADRNGFLMGYLDDEPISSISVVRYDDNYGFLGFYIVHPDHRGKGYGMATWNAGMSYLDGCTIGLDGVVEQQDNYKKSGFGFAGRTIRYAGIPDQDVTSVGNCEISPVAGTHMDAVLEFDRNCFPAPRNDFLHHWLNPGDDSRRHSFVAMQDGTFSGYATIRKCQQGYKIGPLFALAPEAARSLFNACCSRVEPGAQVIIDVPESNTEAIAMAQDHGLEPVFETARMYRGTHPQLETRRIFGSTTLELG